MLQPSAAAAADASSLDFEPVGGHETEDQWLRWPKGPHSFSQATPPSRIVKNTSPLEAVFYAWLAVSAQKEIGVFWQHPPPSTAVETPRRLPVTASNSRNSLEVAHSSDACSTATRIPSGPLSTPVSGGSKFEKVYTCKRFAGFESNVRKGRSRGADTLATARGPRPVTTVDLWNLLFPHELADPDDARRVFEFVPHCDEMRMPPLYEMPVILREAPEHWAGELARVRGFEIQMENLCYGLRRPCVLDIKLGTVLYGPDAGPVKLELVRQKSAKCQASSLGGVRLVAYRTEVDVPVDENDRVSRGQVFWRARSYEQSLDDVQSHFEVYYGAAGDRLWEVAESFKALLLRMRDVFSRHPIAHFFSSSLLFVYDNGSANLRPTVKLIDFVHVDYTKKGLPDEGFLLGLDTLIRVSDTIAATARRPCL